MPQQLTATVTPDASSASWDPVVYLRTPCADETALAELACAESGAGLPASATRSSLPAGTYLPLRRRLQRQPRQRQPHGDPGGTGAAAGERHLRHAGADRPESDRHGRHPERQRRPRERPLPGLRHQLLGQLPRRGPGLRLHRGDQRHRDHHPAGRRHLGSGAVGLPRRVRGRRQHLRRRQRHPQHRDGELRDRGRHDLLHRRGLVPRAARSGPSRCRSSSVHRSRAPPISTRSTSDTP